MDKASQSPDDSDEESVEIVTIPDEFGAVVIGTGHELDEFAQRWEHRNGGGSVVPLANCDMLKLASLSPQLIDTTKTARYVFGPALWNQTRGAGPGTTVTYHRMTRSASTGKILANPRVNNPPAAVGVPAVAVALVGIEIALNQLAARIEARLDVIDDKVDQVLRLASAQRLGDVYGQLRLLKRKLNEVSAGAHLTDTDWSSIASLGTDLEVGVERLRQHAVQLLTAMNDEDPAEKRADMLKNAVEKGRMYETLQLLLVAQQSLYIWQRLRLERVNSNEPDFIAQTIQSARRTLSEQLDADCDLANRLRRTLDKYSVLRVTEVHHQLAARTLTKYRAQLTDMVDRFIEARGLQVDGWLGSQHAGLRDALAFATSKAEEITRAGRKRLAKWIDPDESETPDVR